MTDVLNTQRLKQTDSHICPECGYITLRDRELPVILSEREVLEFLNISAATARRYRRAKKIGFCTFAGKIVYLPRHLDDFLAACEVKAATIE